MEKLKVILDKFLKNKNNNVLYIILIIGIGILILPGTFSSSNKDAKKTIVQSSGNASDVSAPLNNFEEELSKILSDISGAGKVSVMISYEGSGKKVLAYNSKESTDVSDETDSARTKSDSKHTEEKDIIVSSESLPIVVEEEYAKVKGVIVVSEGANDPYIKQALTEAVGAVCDVPIHKIKVFVKK